MHCAAGGSVSEFPGPEPTARPLSHRPHRFSRASVYATDCILTPACGALRYESSNRPHLLIAALPNVSDRAPMLACRNVIEITFMTSNMTSSEAGLSRELNCCSEN